MAKRTTRNKIRWEVSNALTDLHHLQDHLGQAAALANERSEVINDSLPAIMTTLDLVDKSLWAFYDVL